MEKDTEHTEHHAAAPAFSRRDIVILAGVAASAGVTAAILFGRPPAAARLDSGAFLGLLADPASAAKLGEIWFAESKPGETLAVYEARVARRLRAHGWSPAAAPELAHRALAASVRADYLGDRMVAIEKWHLSETEADLCALAALVMRDAAHGA